MCRWMGAWCLGPVLVLSACVGKSDNSTAIALADYCDRLYAAGCDVMDRCMVAGAQDRATCLAMVEDAWDGCPLAQHAAELGEATYDPIAARNHVEFVRDVDCGVSGPAWPDYVLDVPVFTPLLEVGQTCHSDVSCINGMVCEDVTVSEPIGVCTLP